MVRHLPRVGDYGIGDATPARSREQPGGTTSSIRGPHPGSRGLHLLYLEALTQAMSYCETACSLPACSSDAVPGFPA